MGISRVFFPSQPRLHDETGAYSVHTIDYVSHYLSHYVFWICVESGLQENGNTLLLFCLEWLCTMPFGQVPPQGTYFGVIFVAFWTSKFFTIMHYSRVVFEAARVTGFEITTVFLASPPDSFMFSFPVGKQCALWTQHLSTNVTFVLQFEMYVLHVASQIIHSGCYKLTLWARENPFLILVFAFNMTH